MSIKLYHMICFWSYIRLIYLGDWHTLFKCGKSRKNGRKITWAMLFILF